MVHKLAFILENESYACVKWNLFPHVNSIMEVESMSMIKDEVYNIYISKIVASGQITFDHILLFRKGISHNCPSERVVQSEN